MNTKNLIGIIVASTLLSGGMVISAQLLSKFFLRIQHENKLSVKGYAEKTVKSDIGTFTAIVSCSDPDLASAYKNLKLCCAKVSSAVKSYGFKDEEMAVNGMTVNKIYKKINGKDTNDIQYYSLSQCIVVRSNNIELVTSGQKDLYSLLAEGLDVAVNPPDYFISDLEKFKQGLIAGATRNAEERARIMAGNCGGQIKRLLAARQGIIQITAPDSADVSDYGVFDTKSPLKVIKIVVSLDFMLQ
jgi:hypothetical protein